MSSPESKNLSLAVACSSLEQLISVLDQYDYLFWEVYTLKYNLPKALLFRGLDLGIEFQQLEEFPSNSFPSIKLLCLINRKEFLPIGEE
jgi:hypothetical protein